MPDSMLEGYYFSPRCRCSPARTPYWEPCLVERRKSSLIRKVRDWMVDLPQHIEKPFCSRVCCFCSGWVLIDRSGKHFNSILNYLRDGTVTLPKGRQAVQELLVEAKYYLIQGLVELCQNTLQGNKEQPMCVIPVITSYKEEEQLVQSSSKPVVKLLYNRSNNKYSYTSNSDDNLLKNIELFDRLSLSFNSRVLFFKDVIGDEICCWSFYGQGRKLAEVCCTSIVYATEKKQTKVEFPEARIYEETLNTLLYETLPLPDNSLLEATRRSYINCGSLSEEEEGPGGTELRERVRRIHIKRYSTYDDRPLGH
uniref:BTB/POZ domain-containing adapter for CUL3-mediated RhoA degradation protein 2 n=1 Tax=Poecilia latipinna TaxID=48699 RepID=A0A3B3VFP8_9TELE